MQASKIVIAVSLLAIGSCATGSSTGSPLLPNDSRVGAPAVTRHPLIGVWRVVQFCSVDSARRVTNPLGGAPIGVFVYTPTGQLSLHAMRTPPTSPFAAGDNAPTDAERRALLDGYFGYFGTYAITSDSTVTHHVAGGTIPSYIGTDQHRHYRIRAGGSNAPDTLSIGNYPAPPCRKLVRVVAMSTAQEKPVSVEKEPHHKTVFKNRYVQVFRVRLNPGKTSLMHTHFHDDASVRLTTATVAADSPGEPIGPPEPVYPGLLSARDNEAKPHTHRVHNIGTTLFDVINVQVLQRPAGSSSPTVSSPGAENSKMRVYRYDIEPGITTTQHIHARPFLLVAVTDIHLGTISTNGSISNHRVKAGEIQWIDSKVTHRLKNRGTAKAIIAEFELK